MNLEERCSRILEHLCITIHDRCVGNPGNRMATGFFQNQAFQSGWNTEAHVLEVMDWEDRGATFTVDGMDFPVKTSPYSLGCCVESKMLCASSMEELDTEDIQGSILLLHSGLAREQLMPKNFVFYNPDHHRAIISTLENRQPAALVCATGRNSSLAGGACPFPLIEDGDFNIPSVYTTEDQGTRLLELKGRIALLNSGAVRIPEKAYNIIARKGMRSGKKIVVTAHIDSKKGTPGAIDNATGVAVLLLLAEMLGDYKGDRLIELAALNGEDYYAVPGQMQYIRMNEGRFHRIMLNINIDGAGYKQGDTAFSFFDVPRKIRAEAERAMKRFPRIKEGPQWPQGDHSIFVQMGCPALAVTSLWFIENMESQDVTHTDRDNPDIVDCGRVVEIANALDQLIRRA